MNKFIKIVLLLIVGVSITSCHHSTSDDYAINDYGAQWKIDSVAIDTFLDTHHITVDTDYNVVFDTITTTNPLQSIRQQTQYPLGDTLIVQGGINYHVPFLKLREGTQDRPTGLDSAYVSYKGLTLYRKQFDASPNPVWFKLDEVITGWGAMLPNFKTGTYNVPTGNNPVTYSNFGAGVIFLPSALAYYNASVGSVGAYSPMIFTFKLCALRYRDQDRDGVLTKDERDFASNTNPLTQWSLHPADYDSDGDGYPNYLDGDDDGDHTLTKVENTAFTNSITNKVIYYPYNGNKLAVMMSVLGSYTYTWTVPNGATNPGNVSSFISTVPGIYSVQVTNNATGCTTVSNALDMPATTELKVDEISSTCDNSAKLSFIIAPGMPSCGSTTVPATFYDPNRLRKYLDPNCQ